MGLSALQSLTIIGLSPTAASLLGTTSDAARGINYVSYLVEDEDEAEEVARMFRAGRLDSVVARRRFRSREDRLFDAQVTAQAVRWHGMATLGLGLFSLGGAETGPTDASDADVRAGTDVMAHDEEATVAIVQDRWVVCQDNAPDRYLLDIVSEQDAAALLFALARATASGVASDRLRIYHQDGSTRVATVTVRTFEADEHPRFDIHFGPRAASLAVLGDLSQRQRQIAIRLARGDRVGMIAEALYLSRSTVRNHLVAIFRKAGVHNQAELLQVLRDENPPSG
jgi:DNA-binding CsgD family transcriptional regulator